MMQPNPPSLRVEASESLSFIVAFMAGRQNEQKIKQALRDALGAPSSTSLSSDDGGREFVYRYSTVESFNEGLDRAHKLKPELDGLAFYPVHILTRGTGSQHKGFEIDAGFDLEAQMAGVTLYHGTHIEYLPAILQEGFKGARQGSVFLTADFEKAARYGLYSESRGRIEDEPVIFEVYLSKPKRVRKLKYDPLDREDLWYDDSYDSPESDELNDAKAFFEEGWETIQQATGRMNLFPGWPHYFDPGDLVGLDDLEKVINTNLWRDVVEFLLTKLPIDRAALVRLVKSAYPPGEYGFLVVREDGSLALNEDWYNSREQLYMKGNLSRRTIKRVWLLKDRHPDAQGPVRNAGARELPQESRNRLKVLTRRLGQLPRDVARLDDFLEGFLDNPHAWDPSEIDRVSYDLDHCGTLLEGVVFDLQKGLGPQIYAEDLKESRNLYARLERLSKQWHLMHEASLVQELSEKGGSSAEQIINEGEFQVSFAFMETMTHDEIKRLIEQTRAFAGELASWSENMRDSADQEWGETQVTKPFAWVGVDPKEALALVSSQETKTASVRVEASFELEAAKVDDLMEKYPALADEIEFLDEADPSPTKRYLEWGVKRLIAGERRALIERAMERFDLAQNKLKGEEKDVNRYKSAQDMIDVAERALASKSRREKETEIKSEGAELVAQADGAKTYYIKTKEASILYGKGTKWCTAGTEYNTFDQYASMGVKLYYTMGPKGKTAIAFMRRGGGLMGELYNAQNDRLTVENFPYPETLRLLLPDADQLGIEVIIFATFEGEPAECEVIDFDYGRMSPSLLASYERRFAQAAAEGLGARIYINGFMLSEDVQDRLDSRDPSMVYQIREGTGRLISTGAASYKSVNPEGTEGRTEMPWVPSIAADDDDVNEDVDAVENDDGDGDLPPRMAILACFMPQHVRTAAKKKHKNHVALAPHETDVEVAAFGKLFPDLPRRYQNRDPIPHDQDVVQRYGASAAFELVSKADGTSLAHVDVYTYSRMGEKYVRVAFSEAFIEGYGYGRRLYREVMKWAAEKGGAWFAADPNLVSEKAMKVWQTLYRDPTLSRRLRTDVGPTIEMNEPTGDVRDPDTGELEKWTPANAPYAFQEYRIARRPKASRRVAASIATKDSQGRQGSLYLERVRAGDAVCFVEPVMDADLHIDADAVGAVVHVDLGGPRLLVDVIGRRASGVREERVWTSPDNVALLINTEDTRMA